MDVKLCTTSTNMYAQFKVIVCLVERDKILSFHRKGHYGIALCRQNCDIRLHGIPARPPTCWAVDHALLAHRPDYADLQPETTRSGFSFWPFVFHEPGALRKCEFVFVCV